MKKNFLVLLLFLFSVVSSNSQTRPKLSTDTDEYWYYIQFKNGGAVIQDMGNNTDLLTKSKVEGLASQLWKLTGTKDNYIFISKEGRKINYVSDRFQASSGSVKLALLSTSNTTYAPAWELKRTGQSQCMNQWGGAGTDKPLGQWNAGDNNNPLIFLPEDPFKELIPEISDNEDIWHYIRFKNGGAVLQDIGNGEMLKTKVARKRQDSQLWKITRSAEGYAIQSKSGNKIAFSNGHFLTSAEHSCAFTFLPTTNTTHAPALELQRTGSGKCMNQWTGAGLDRLLGEWDYGDDNNPLLFIKPEDMDDMQNPITGNLLDYTGCSKIKTLSLPSCTRIGEYAFYAATVLEQLSFPHCNPPAYGKKAFYNPENTTIAIDNQNNTIVSKWRAIEEWDAFIWKNISSTGNTNAPEWLINIRGNDLTISGLTPGAETRLISITGEIQSFSPTPNGTLHITLPGGFYIVNQDNKSQKIIITK